jgi:hypothetical protein
MTDCFAFLSFPPVASRGERGGHRCLIANLPPIAKFHPETFAAPNLDGRKLPPGRIGTDPSGPGW